MGKESERFFELINGTMDTMLLAGAAMGLASLALKANAAYTDMKKENLSVQEVIQKAIHKEQ